MLGLSSSNAIVQMLNYHHYKKIIPSNVGSLFFNFIFATNLIIIIVMDKKDFKELDAVGLRDYYSKLSRSEKGRFLRYLVGEMGLGYNSMVVKFNN